MKQVINKDEVGKAIQDLVGQGKKPTLAAVHAALNNRGSMSTLVRLKAEIEAAAQPVNDSADGLKAFREIWALAVDEGRRQQEAVVLELRESVKALAMENERLEGVVLAANNHVAEAEQAKTRAEAQLTQMKDQIDGELKQAKAALTEATAESANALKRLSELQASCAAHVAGLQAELTAAVRRAHDFELQLVRANALLEANEIQPTGTIQNKAARASENRS
jgi:hypothetical protein